MVRMVIRVPLGTTTDCEVVRGIDVAAGADEDVDRVELGFELRGVRTLPAHFPALFQQIRASGRELQTRVRQISEMQYRPRHIAGRLNQRES